MSVLIKSYTKALRSYDRELFASRTKDGVPCVFRRHKRFVSVGDLSGGTLYQLIEGKQFVIALTDNWTARGKPRNWGIDRVLDRIREIDALANERLLEEMDRHNDKVDESKRRSVRNEMEAFWSHERRRFAKATDDILTHSLSKNETRKRLKDRSIKNGNY